MLHTSPFPARLAPGVRSAFPFTRFPDHGCCLPLPVLLHPSAPLCRGWREFTAKPDQVISDSAELKRATAF